MLIDVDSANTTKPSEILLSDYPKLSPPQFTTSIVITPTRPTTVSTATTMPIFASNYTKKWPSGRPLAPNTITKWTKVPKVSSNNQTSSVLQGKENAKKIAHLYTAGSFIGGIVVIIIAIVMTTFGVKFYKGLGSRNYNYLRREEGFSL